MNLPKTGIYDEKGQLFHHCTVQALSEEHYQRLEQHGIDARSYKQFTLEETVQIFKNWQSYANMHGIPVTEGLSYVGDDGIKDGRREKLRRERKRNGFWVELSRGLPHRTGRQVYRRASRVFDPTLLAQLNSADENSLKNLIHSRFFKKTTKKRADEMLVKVAWLLNANYRPKDVATKLRVSIDVVRHYKRKIDNWQKLDLDEKLKVAWGIFVKAGLEEIKFRNALISEDKLEMKRVTSEINWAVATKSVIVTERSARRLWKKLRVRAVYEFKKRKEQDYTDEEAFEAVTMIFSTKPGISIQEEIRGIEILCSLIRPNMRFDKDVFNRTEFKTRLEEEGITNLGNPLSSHINQVVELMRNRLRILDKVLFDNLPNVFDWKVKTHILMWTLKRIWIWSRFNASSTETIAQQVFEAERENPYMTKWTKNFLKNKYVQKWLEESESGNETVSTKKVRYASECLVLFCTRTYQDSFVFPVKLHRLISSQTVTAMLSKKNNDQLHTNKKSVLQIKRVVRKEDFVVSTINKKSVTSAEAVEKENNKQNRCDFEEESVVDWSLLSEQQVLEDEMSSLKKYKKSRIASF